MKTINALAACVLILFGISCNQNVPVSYIETTGAEEKILAKLTIEGMMCERACGTKIAKELQNATGVTSVQVNFEEGRPDNFASVTYDGKLTDPEKIAEVVDAIADGKLYKVKAVEVIHMVKRSNSESETGDTRRTNESQLSEQLPLLKIFQFLERLIARPQ